LGHHILVAEQRDIARRGLKNIFVEDPLVTSVREATTCGELQQELKTCMPDLLIIHQSLASNPHSAVSENTFLNSHPTFRKRAEGIGLSGSTHACI